MRSFAVNFGVACLLLVFAWSPQVRAEDEVTPGVFLGAIGGVGFPRIEHEDLEDPSRPPGAFYTMGFGIAPSERWAVGFEFSTWGTNVLLVPVHLHTLGPRVEWAPYGRTGPMLGVIAGLALTMGEVQSRAGVAGAGLAGWGWSMGRWATVILESGVHGHLYDEDRTVVLPYAGIQLRLHGRWSAR